MEFGTHTIFVGEAVDLGSTEGQPLLFYRGKYAKVPDGTLG
jgi:hypothetical protein